MPVPAEHLLASAVQLFAELVEGLLRVRHAIGDAAVVDLVTVTVAELDGRFRAEEIGDLLRGWI